jgi:hypothetical protein
MFCCTFRRNSSCSNPNAAAKKQARLFFLPPVLSQALYMEHGRTTEGINFPFLMTATFPLQLSATMLQEI